MSVSPKGIVLVVRVALVLITVAAMVPLSYMGFLGGGGLGAEAFESWLGSNYSLLGMVVGSTIIGGISLAIPASLAVWLDRTVERRLLGSVAAAKPQ